MVDETNYHCDPRVTWGSIRDKKIVKCDDAYFYNNAKKV